jgi:hypothetical protein
MQTLQSVNIQQIYEGYWNWTLGGLAIGVGLAGLLPFLQELRRGGDKWHWPSEPLRSICLVLLALAVSYPASGFVGKVAESPHPHIIYWSLFGALMIVLLAHLMVLWHYARGTKEGWEALSRLQATTDIEAVFDEPSDPQFIKALTHDLGQVHSARVVTIGHDPLDEWSALWKALSSFVTAGGRIRVISDVPLRRGAAIVDCQRVPEVAAGLMRGVFAIDCGGPFYFGIGPVHDNLVIARFDGRPAGGNSLASGVYLLVNQLSRLIEGGLNQAVTIRAAASPAEYKEMIIPLESEARRIDRLPKRIFVVFKTEAVVHAIAEQRYGTGSTHIEHYVEEHKERSTRFFAALGRGMVCREIYNKSELLTYVRGRRHGRRVILTRAQMEETIMRWRDAIISQPHYLVGLTESPLPFKYELIDGMHFVMHEAIGQNDEGRMNAFRITGVEFCKKPLNDFEIIWNSIPAEARMSKNVAKWIETDLLAEIRTN